jgi:hypothetical protein
VDAPCVQQVRELGIELVSYYRVYQNLGIGQSCVSL